jgi:hypothetical protein
VHLDIRMTIHRVEEAEDRGRVDLLIRWHDASLGHNENHPGHRGWSLMAE